MWKINTCTNILQIANVLLNNSNNYKLIINEVLSHILNMNSLYCFNFIWKVAFLWFHKNHPNKVFHSNKHNYVENKISGKKSLLKNYFHLKNSKNYIGGLWTKSISHVYQNTKWNWRKSNPQKILNAFFF